MTVTPEARQTLLASGELSALLAELNSASTLLASARVIPAEVRELIKTLPERLRADAPFYALPGDPYLSEQAYAGTSRAVAALLDDDASRQRRQARLGLEQVRQAIRDIVEAREVDDDVPVVELTAWLESVLGGSTAKIAHLVGTSPTTWQRWASGRQQPDDVGALRLRRAARLVGHLRHTLTGPGVLNWFSRPHPAIKDGAGTPSDLLDDAEGYRLLISLAAGLRSTQAS